MTVSIIAAVAENNVIGRDNALPWRLPADLKHFKALTTGHSIIMGRKTWESLGRPLPNRVSIVVTRTPELEAPGATVVRSLEMALEHCSEDKEVFLIGGEAIFREGLETADRIYLTRIHATIEGDVFFPEDWVSRWKLTSEERHSADEKNPYDFSFQIFERA